MAAQPELPFGELAHCQVRLEMLPLGAVSLAVKGVATRGCDNDSVTVPAASDAGAVLKTQGRACLIASTLPLVILNSISMANGSPAPGLYSFLNSSWMTPRCRQRSYTESKAGHLQPD